MLEEMLLSGGRTDDKVKRKGKCWSDFRRYVGQGGVSGKWRSKSQPGA